MASLPPRTACVHQHHHHHHHQQPHHKLPFHPISLHFTTSIPSLPSPISLFPCSFNHSRPSAARRHPSFCGSPVNLNRALLRCHAGIPGPPPGNEPPSSSGVIPTISRLRDTLQIFFAVFLWMSLFFWASATGGNKNDRRNKGNRSRK